MQDKPTDDKDFDLNKFDLKNEKDEHSQSSKTDPFDDPFADETTAGFDFEENKQAPSIPQTFEPVKDDVFSDDMNTMTFDDHHVSNAGMEEPITAADDVGHLEVDDFPNEADEPVAEESDNKIFFIFLIVAVVIIAVVAWFNLTGSDDAVNVKHTTQAVLVDDVKFQRMGKKLSETQAQLLLMEKRLTSKDKEIAELTHLIAEQNRLQRRLVTEHQAELLKHQTTSKVQSIVIPKPVVSPKPMMTPTVVKHHPEVTTETIAQKQVRMAPAPVIVKKRTGAWGIVLASVNSRSGADNAVAELNAKGIPADISHIEVKGRPWYRIRVSGFSSRQEALAQQAYLAKEHGIKGTWINKSK